MIYSICKDNEFLIKFSKSRDIKSIRVKQPYSGGKPTGFGRKKLENISWESRGKM